jgi:recombination protein RecA
LSQPGCLEEAMDVVDKLVKSNGIDIIVVDSVAALVPRSEIEGEEMLKDTMAVQARLMGKALRILTGSIARSRTIVIFINQIREKVGVFFGNKETTPGGKALKFFSSVRIDVKRGDKIEGKDKELIGYTLKTTMVKNKVGYPWRQANFDLYFGGGIDLIADAVAQGEKLGLIKKTGNTYSFKDVKVGVGKDQTRDFFKDKKDSYNILITEIKQEMKKITKSN